MQTRPSARRDPALLDAQSHNIPLGARESFPQSRAYYSGVQGTDWQRIHTGAALRTREPDLSAARCSNSAFELARQTGVDGAAEHVSTAAAGDGTPQN